MTVSSSLGCFGEEESATSRLAGDGRLLLVLPSPDTAVRVLLSSGTGGRPHGDTQERGALSASGRQVLPNGPALFAAQICGHGWFRPRGQTLPSEWILRAATSGPGPLGHVPRPHRGCGHELAETPLMRVGSRALSRERLPWGRRPRHHGEEICFCILVTSVAGFGNGRTPPGRRGTCGPRFRQERTATTSRPTEAPCSCRGSHGATCHVQMIRHQGDARLSDHGESRSLSGWRSKSHLPPDSSSDIMGQGL